MKQVKQAIIVAVVCVVAMALVLGAMFVVTNFVFADEIENEQTGTTFEDAQNNAESIVEKLELKEYLSQYFDEHMVELIISITISVLTALGFVSSIIVTVSKLIKAAKQFGVESDATKEIARQLVDQLKDTEKAMAELEKTKKLIEENNAEIKAELEKTIKETKKVETALQIAFNNDEKLVVSGVATKINEVVSE